MAYINGDDMLFSMNGKALGSCDSHECSYDTETKQVATKPVSTEAKKKALFKEEIVVGLSMGVSFSGLIPEGTTAAEKQLSYAEILKAWKGGVPIDGAAFYRSGDATPYIKGKFIIKSLKETHKSGDFSVYSGSLALSGEPEVFDDTKFQPGAGV